MQEILRGRRRSGFVGREAERAAFRENFSVAPEDERHRFLFHIHGDAGVGKTFLIGELEQIACEQGALTACVDESAGSVSETLGALGSAFARKGHRFRELERLLTMCRERQHEAAALDLDDLPDSVPEPSPGSMAAARASLLGLGLLPGVGAFAGVVDPTHLALGADRLRAGLSARLRSQEDVQLVLSPEQVLTPVFLQELSDTAASVPWIVLFFDTYERTAPFLDGWLRDLMTTSRYGDLSSRVIVVTAGQYGLDAAGWGGFTEVVEDWPLEHFTEAEARGLLTKKGVVSEPVVREVLRLSGGLPVLVSTLAASKPTDPGSVSDPSSTAVERFLKWEQDPLRRAAALAGALPRRLDVDVFQAAYGCAETEAAALFHWLRSLPFVAERAHGVRYHDVVRAQMLRLQRRGSPRDWKERHAALAETFSRWRVQAENSLAPGTLWNDDGWRELRMSESYHLLCGGSRTERQAVLRDVVAACEAGEVLTRHWVQVFQDSGRDAEAEEIRAWGRDLNAALVEGGAARVLQLLLDRAGFGPEGQAAVLATRASLRHSDGEFRSALADYNRAIALSPQAERAYVGRAQTRAELGEYPAAIDDLNRADTLAPNTVQTLRRRGDYYRITGRHSESMRDLHRAVELDPVDHVSWTSRGATHDSLGDTEAALADLDHALQLKPDSVRALIHRARVRTFQREARQLVLDDLNRAVAIEPDAAWVRYERGATLRILGDSEAALVDFDRAIELDRGYWRAYSGRGTALGILHRYADALSDLNRALELFPLDSWTLSRRCWVHCRLGEYDRGLADADQALALSPGDAATLMHRAEALHNLGRFEEARNDLEATIERGFGHANTWSPWRRIDFCLAIGRLDQAQADLQFYVQRGRQQTVARAHRILARVHLLCGQPEQAIAALQKSLTAGVEDQAVLETLCTAHRQAGRESAARQAAHQLRRRDEAAGLAHLALTMEAYDRTRAAHTWQHAAEQAKRRTSHSARTQHQRSTVIHAALRQWTAMDTELAHVLASSPRWNELAELANTLGELHHAAGSDRARLVPRLAAVAAARDAIEARYT